MTNDTWYGRDLLVLDVIVRLSDAGIKHVSPEHIAENAGMSEGDVRAALFALAEETPPFFQYVEGGSLAGREIGSVHSVTGHARRAVGAWPTPEGLADRLVAAMERAAEAEPDEERRGWLRRTAAFMGTAGRDVLVDVTASVIAKGTGVA